LNVGVFFGGKSCEHEISVITALQVMEELKSKYQVFPVYLSKMNEFILLEDNVNINCFPDVKGKKLIFSKGKINKIPLDVAVLCFHGNMEKSVECLVC